MPGEADRFRKLAQVMPEADGAREHAGELDTGVSEGGGGLISEIISELGRARADHEPPATIPSQREQSHPAQRVRPFRQPQLE